MTDGLAAWPPSPAEHLQEDHELRKLAESIRVNGLLIPLTLLLVVSSTEAKAKAKTKSRARGSR